MKTSKYIKLGALVVFSIAALIWGLSFLKGNDFFSNNSYYHILYDRIDGLVESDAVTLNGYQVGQVKTVDFANNGSGRLIVTITVDGELKIPINSVARIVSSNIMGTKSIQLIFNPHKEVYSSNDTIPGAVESGLKEQVSLQVLPLKAKAEQLLASFDSAMTILTVIFNKDARNNLSESFKNLNTSISNIEDISEQLKKLISNESGNVSDIIENFGQVSSTFKTKSSDIDNIITKLSLVSDSLAAIPFSPLISSLGQAINQIEDIITKINTDEGTAGKLINNPRLYNNLITLTNDLDKLISDIRLNPKRYVNFSAFDFGKEVYVTSPPAGKNGKIVFKVNLISTQNKIPLNSELFEGLGEIEEYSASNTYSYLSGATNNYNEILSIHQKALENFPDAEIIAFKNGKPINLKRALKKTTK